MKTRNEEGKEDPAEENGKEHAGMDQTTIDSEDVSRLRAENEELVKTLKRLQAEFENYQKRMDKEKEEWDNRGRQAVLVKLITLADEFEAATAHMHKSSESELRNGIRLLQKKLLAVLDDEGVEEIECLGRKFDPDLCDAVEMVEDDGEDGIVAKEMRKGYSRNGKVIRHAMVGVTKKKNEGEAKENGK